MITFAAEMPDYRLVDHPDSLGSVLQGLDRVGVDTEFMREKTFFAELCLVQVANRDEILIVDPLAANGVGQFWQDLLAIPWVVHSGRQDIEVIYQTAGSMPQAIFDTQIAAGLLGHPPQLGYASLISELFDVELDKSHTRANWSRRPLTDGLLYYAAEDVEYLLPAFDTLAEALDRKGRLDWAEEDSARLLDPVLYEFHPEAAIDRLKGARNLRGKRRGVAVRLAEWREAEALRANRPRQWIVRDNVLLDLAARLPSSADELRHVEGLPAGLIRRAGEDILAAIANPAAADPAATPPRGPNEAQKALLRAMQERVAVCADELGLAAETVASKRDLTAVIIGGDRTSKLLRGWRKDLIGNELLAAL